MQEKIILIIVRYWTTGREIIAALNQDDRNNTDILITSDHGDMLGDHGMMYKSTFLEGSKSPVYL